ncbi:accessory regulator AgrB, partial [Clostridium perfringens]|nr:accessory regulator AgrB [Clostridium perfringens]
MIENISRAVAEKVSNELNYDNERKEVIQYGTYALIQTLISIISVLILGLIFNIALEALIFLFTASILRKYSGGAHSESSNVCTLLGIVISICIGFLIKSSFFVNMNFQFIIFIGVVVFVFAYFIIFKYAPVDTPNKPIKTEKKKKRMKKGSLKILTIYLFIVLLSTILYYNSDVVFAKSVILSILFGIAWQCMTLTSLGNILLKTIDSFTNKI